MIYLVKRYLRLPDIRSHLSVYFPRRFRFRSIIWTFVQVVCVVTLVSCERIEAINDSSTQPPDQVWSDDIANSLIGKHILIGYTYLNSDGSLNRQEQLHGIVSRADRDTGIEILLKGTREGETKWLPPDTRGINPAEPGTYKLKKTGEEVLNPDFTASWTVSAKPAP